MRGVPHSTKFTFKVVKLPPWQLNATERQRHWLESLDELQTVAGIDVMKSKLLVCVNFVLFDHLILSKCFKSTSNDSRDMRVRVART
jgi:hypothetical protein